MNFLWGNNFLKRNLYLKAYMFIFSLFFYGLPIAVLADTNSDQAELSKSPLLIDIGANDSCFRVDTAMACFKKLEKIYAAAKASKELQLDLSPGEHGWSGKKAVAFFKQHLGCLEK